MMIANTPERLAAMVRVDLPFPIPLHACFRNVAGKGRVRTSRYLAYSKNASKELLVQRPAKIKGPVSVHVSLVAPDARARDGDNLLKCLFDTLKHNGLIEDDSNRIIVRHSLVWAPHGPPCTVIIQQAVEALAA